MTAAWDRAILPAGRDPAQRNPLQDGIARLYRLMEPGERFAGMVITVIDGHRTVRLALDRDGGVRRVVVNEQDEVTWALIQAPRRQAAVLRLSRMSLAT